MGISGLVSFVRSAFAVWSGEEVEVWSGEPVDSTIAVSGDGSTWFIINHSMVN